MKVNCSTGCCRKLDVAFAKARVHPKGVTPAATLAVAVEFCLAVAAEAASADQAFLIKLKTDLQTSVAVADASVHQTHADALSLLLSHHLADAMLLHLVVADLVCLMA